MGAMRICAVDEGPGESVITKVVSVADRDDFEVRALYCTGTMRIVGVNEMLVVDVFTNMVIVAEMVGVLITSNGVSACYCLPSGCKGPKPIIATIDSRDTKHQLMGRKSCLEASKWCFKNDLTHFVPT